MSHNRKNRNSFSILRNQLELYNLMVKYFMTTSTTTVQEKQKMKPSNKSKTHE